MTRGKRDADVEERLEERGRRGAEAAREADDVGDERARERRRKRAERDAVRRGGKDVRAVLGRLPTAQRSSRQQAVACASSGVLSGKKLSRAATSSAAGTSAGPSR